jgi:hypothetical protein
MDSVCAIFAIFFQQVKIEKSVLIVKKDILLIIASLDYMVRVSWGYHSGNA